MNVQSSIKAAFLILALGLGLVVAPPSDAKRNRGEQQETKKEALYPNATRQEPKAKASPRLQRDMQKLGEAYDNDDYAQVVALGDKLVASKSAGAYERSWAYQLIAIAKSEQDDMPGAIEAYAKAIESNGLDNNSHYQMMLQLAQLEAQEDRLQEADDTMDRLLSETRAESAQLLAFKGSVAYQLENYQEAADFMKRAIAASDKPQESWTQMLMAAYINQEKFDEATALGEQLLAQNPDDTRMVFNVATMYAQNDQYDKATALLEGARARGQLDERGYRQLYALYMNMEGKEAPAIAAINDGLQKGILQPSGEIYSVLGQAYYFSDQPTQAIDAYRKALPFAKDGESALNLARMLSNEEQYAESKKIAQEAIAKGLRRPGDAWIVIGRAEFGQGNRAGLVSAYKEAAKYPETKEVAEEWLKKNASR